MEEIVSLLNEIKQLSTLIIPAFIFSLFNYFLIAIRFIYWFIDVHKTNEKETYLRLKAKYEKDGGNNG